MTKRRDILEAAASLFAKHGYRGATTRRIAADAGVNEVTVFRLFGTKEQLLREALVGATALHPAVKALPVQPADPERELVQWCGAYLRQLRAARDVLRTSMGEVAHRPNVMAEAAAVTAHASRLLRDYLSRASRDNLLPPDFDATAAATILAGVLFADAISRDLVPDGFPKRVAEAPRRYVRLILDGIHHAACSETRRFRQTARRAPKAAAVDKTPGKTAFDRRRRSTAPTDANGAHSPRS